MKKYYKIAFCGLGSIGKRHLKNTISFLKKNKCEFQIDAIRSDLSKALESEIEDFISGQYSYHEEIPSDYDIIFITNPTSMHVECIEKYKYCTKSMFIEKPISNDCNYEPEGLPEELVCYVACPLRYTKVLQYLKENWKLEDVYSVRAICSTYLPGWHPDEDYRKSYSAHKDMGGGVAIDLIHEWDYLVWLFGLPDQVKGMYRKMSDLEIDTEDVSIYIGCSKDKTYELHLDYFGREEIRMLEIYMKDETIKADLRNGWIYSAKTGRIVLEEDRDEYQMKEIEHFFDIIDGKFQNDNDIRQAIRVLKIAKESE